MNKETRKPCGAMEAHQTSNLGVLGSSPSKVVFFYLFALNSLNVSFVSLIINIIFFLIN